LLLQQQPEKGLLGVEVLHGSVELLADGKRKIELGFCEECEKVGRGVEGEVESKKVCLHET
jgi:hypothetical protein